MSRRNPQQTPDEWVSFPGGELEGRRPKALCPTCRETLRREASARLALRAPRLAPRTLCFACYRAELDRQKAIADAGRIDTASEARFQYQLPFEPVDYPRLEMLKADRGTARAADRATPIGPFADRRRKAQIEARHALQRIATELRARAVAKADRDRAAASMAGVFHAAELQLPESWIPFVMSR